MKRLVGFAAAALCCGVVGTAQAQQGAMSGPGLLALPQVYTPSHYDFYLASQGIGAAPEQPAPSGVRQTAVRSGPQPQYSFLRPNPAPMHSASAFGYGDPMATPGPTADESLFADGTCDECFEGCPDCCLPERCRWFGSAAALFFNRDRGNKAWTTYETGNNPNQLMNTQDAASGWGWGGEATFGRWFGCADQCGGYGCGIAATFWGWDPRDGYSSIYSPTDMLSTPYDLGGVSIDGTNVSAYFDNARRQYIRRDDEVYNVEVNWWHFLGGYSNLPPAYGGRGLQAGWLAGVRWFRFDENLVFGSVANGNFGEDPTNEAFLDDSVTNDLIGFQVGGRVQCNVWRNFALYAQPKFGIYGNHISHRAQLYRGDGAYAFDLKSSKDDVSFLAEIDVGGSWYFTRNWSVFAAYRVVAVTGIALADEQIPHFWVDYPEWVDINSNGDLILHGLVTGLQYNF